MQKQANSRSSKTKLSLRGCGCHVQLLGVADVCETLALARWCPWRRLARRVRPRAVRACGTAQSRAPRPRPCRHQR
eukprot:802765-Pleurochrysis_carterae.AAC.1